MLEAWNANWDWFWLPEYLIFYTRSSHGMHFSGCKMILRAQPKLQHFSLRVTGFYEITFSSPRCSKFKVKETYLIGEIMFKLIHGSYDCWHSFERLSDCFADAHKVLHEIPIFSESQTRKLFFSCILKKNMKRINISISA